VITLTALLFYMNKQHLIAAVLIVLASVGCKTRSNDPKALAKEWLTNVYSLNWESADKLSTAECRQLVATQRLFLEAQPKEQIAEYKKTKWEIVGEPKIDGNNATVIYRESTFPGDVKLPMIKVDGQWMVNMTKDSYQEDKDDMPASGDEAIPVGVDSINMDNEKMP
jgi:hypothetical protein